MQSIGGGTSTAWLLCWASGLAANVNVYDEVTQLYVEYGAEATLVISLARRMSLC